MAEKEVHTTKAKKSARKTTVKKTVAKVGVTKRTPVKKTASKKTATAPKKVARKAPTPVAKVRAHEKKTNMVFWSGAGVLLIILVGSIMFGASSAGKINIEKRTTDVRESATPEEQAVIDSIPVQTTSLPDGGLVPSGVPLEAPVAAPVSTTTDDLASTTPDTASSTSVQTDTEGDSETLSTTTVSTGTTTDTEIIP